MGPDFDEHSPGHDFTSDLIDLTGPSPSQPRLIPLLSRWPSSRAQRYPKKHQLDHGGVDNAEHVVRKNRFPPATLQPTLSHHLLSQDRLHSINRTSLSKMAYVRMCLAENSSMTPSRNSPISTRLQTMDSVHLPQCANHTMYKIGK